MNIAGRKYNRGFTLIELLVVLAISMILMGLVLYPVTQSFKMTRSAQAMVDSQDAARFAMEQISRDLGEAMDIIQYDNALPLQIPVRQPNGSVEYLDVPNAKIDFVLPKMLVHCNNPNHPVDSTNPNEYPRDFERGDEALPICKACAGADEDPTDVEIRPMLPLEPDTKVVRYFLGLMYNNPHPTDLTGPDFGWLSPWGRNVEAGKGNQVVLYRIEFDPDDKSIFGTDKAAAVEELQNILKDPKFFYSEEPTLASGGTGGEKYWQAWARRARIVGVGKYEDLVDGVDSNNDGVWEALDPCVTFRHKMMDNDAFTGTYATDQSFEYPDAVPAVYQGEYGYWMPGYGVSVYRYTYGSDGLPSKVTAFTLGVQDLNTVIEKSDFPMPDGPWTTPLPIFNITAYLTDLAGGKILIGTINSSTEMAFTVDPLRGRVDFAITPPTPSGSASICSLDPHDINEGYKGAYVIDRSKARRYAILNTFDIDSSNYLGNATIVPGSERVVGPDMTPGSKGDYVAYKRVPFALGEPGFNQYRINYDTGEIFFSPVYDQDLPVINSNTGEAYSYPYPDLTDVPIRKIRVDYKVHFNRDGDVVRGDYQTKAAVVIHLGMKMYDPESGKPHSVDLSNTIKVRNALR